MADDNEINVKVTATTDKLSSGLNRAKDDVKDFGDEINNLAQKTAALKPDAFKELNQEFAQGKIDLDEFRDGLIALNTVQSAAATEAATLAEKTVISSGALREFTVIGRELASGNLTRLPGSLSLLATRLGGIPPQAILAAMGIAAVTYAIYEFVESSEQFESDLDKIQNAFTAVGSTNSFDRTQITQYIDDLRQIPGVTEEMATAAINNFARVQNGTKLLGQATADLNPFAELIGVKVPEAANILASALNNPIRGIQDLRKYGVELNATQEEQIRQMMAVNDVAGAQAVLLDGISTAMAHVVDTSTGLQRFWTDFKNSLSGVSEEAAQTKKQLEELAETASDPDVAAAARLWGSVEGLKSRNVPSANWSGSSGTVAGGDQKQANDDRAEQQKQLNAAIKDGNDLADKSNAPLIEEQRHIETITRLNKDLNAAIKQATDGLTAQERQSGADAAPRIQAAIDQENKLYAQRTNRNDRGDDKYAEAQAKATAEAADAEIETQRQKVDEELRLGQISSADAVKQLKDLEAQEHAINLQRIADMRSVYQKQGDRAGVASTAGDEQKEDQRDTQANSKIDTQGAEAIRAAQDAEMEGDRRVADEKIRTAQSANQLKVALGEMSAQDEIQAEINAAAQKMALDDKYYESLMANEAKDSAAYIKNLNDKLIAEQKFQQQVLALRTRLAQQTQQQDNQLAQSLQRGLNQTVSGVLQGTQTMSQAFQRLGQNIIISVVEGSLDKIVQKFLSNNATIEAAQSALNDFLDITSESSSEDQQQQVDDSSNAQIDDYAAVGAAAAAASAASGGPGAAAAAGAATFAIIEAFHVGAVASAAGGWVVPSDQLAMVHENEMILPAHLSQGIAGMIANGGQSGGGGHTFNNTFNVNAGNGISAQQLPDMIVKTMTKAMRNGAFGGMRGG